jgi:hypothetical protein
MNRIQISGQSDQSNSVAWILLPAALLICTVAFWARPFYQNITYSSTNHTLLALPTPAPLMPTPAPFMPTPGPLITPRGPKPTGLPVPTPLPQRSLARHTIHYILPTNIKVPIMGMILITLTLPVWWASQYARRGVRLPNSTYQV